METLDQKTTPIEQIKTSKPQLFRSKPFLITVAILLELILLVGAFSLGLKVAYRKARYTYTWMSNYPANFGLAPGPGVRFFATEPGDHEFINASGVYGQIISNNNSVLIIKGADNVEKTVTTATSTAVRQGFVDIKPSDLKTGQQIVVIGEADDNGQIEAKLIRVLNP